MEIILNKHATRYTAFNILALISVFALSGCFESKPTSEEIAMQVKAAIAEEKAKEQAAVPAAVAAPKPAVTAAQPASKPKHVAHTKPDQAPLIQSQPAQPQAAQAQAVPVEKIVCTNCGLVIAVNVSEVAGKGSGLGAIAGGVAGGLLGNQVGQGTGKDVATFVGVFGGGYAGHKLEQNVRKTKVYDVIVKMDTGEERTLRHNTDPVVVAGDKVKVESDLVVKQ